MPAWFHFGNAFIVRCYCTGRGVGIGARSNVSRQLFLCAPASLPAHYQNRLLHELFVASRKGDDRESRLARIDESSCSNEVVLHGKARRRGT